MSAGISPVMRRCVSVRANKNKDNNRHWCSGVPAVKLRQAAVTGYEKKHALVPGLSMREENWEYVDRVRTNKNHELVEVSGRG